jgi:hypothetical protein
METMTRVHQLLAVFISIVFHPMDFHKPKKWYYPDESAEHIFLSLFVSPFHVRL